MKLLRPWNIVLVRNTYIGDVLQFHYLISVILRLVSSEILVLSSIVSWKVSWNKSYSWKVPIHRLLERSNPLRLFNRMMIKKTLICPEWGSNKHSFRGHHRAVVRLNVTYDRKVDELLYLLVLELIYLNTCINIILSSFMIFVI